MDLLLRLLGLNLLAHVGTRMPIALVRTLSSLALIAANLLPILAVAAGHLALADVFVLYWLENVVVWLLTTLKLLTCEKREIALAGFFALHYGIFTLVHGIFAFVLAFTSGGFIGGRFYWIVVPAALLGSHLISLGLNWFGSGEYRVAKPGRVMMLPYPRMLVLHGSIIAAALLTGWGEGAATETVALLCVAKTVVDLGFHLVERLRVRR